MELSELQNSVTLLKLIINQVLRAAPPASSGLQPGNGRLTRTIGFFHLKTALSSQSAQKLTGYDIPLQFMAGF